MKTNMHITVDGPAGSGKSTIAKRLAQRLHMTYIDTGAMYRAITYKVIQGGIEPGDRQGIIKIAASVQIELKGSVILLDGVDVSSGIRDPSVDSRVSEIASIPEVRERMVALQRQMAQKESVVMDGRDIGTSVLPDARYKFFLIATLEERAKRRFKDLARSNPGIGFDRVIKEMQRRDILDSTRGHSPLRAADDAIIIDTTDKGIAAVLKEITDIVGGKGRCFTK
ncbi:MAG: (d)CMP kinase [Bacillota bacterium]|nr:(d)CMP kinase [Bacillota bacterium]MDD3299095.1 (d)CMP kinase [Bacillota bacterium]MDD4707838.1 (d)CMP kinase [Bacillota bacterium]